MAASTHAPHTGRAQFEKRPAMGFARMKMTGPEFRVAMMMGTCAKTLLPRRR